MRSEIATFCAAVVVAMVTVSMAQDCQTQPRATMMCRAHSPAWFFNTTSGQCQLRGCHNGRPNQNKFQTEEECEQQCEGAAAGAAAAEEAPQGGTGATGKCQLPFAVGNCRGRFRRFYFDAAAGRCKRFFYGGCGGNANNFKRKSECRSSCGGRRRPDIPEIEITPQIQ